MKEKTRTRGIGFWTLLTLTGLVFAALLELNKNTLAAWGLCAMLLAGWALLRRKALRGKGFLLRLAAFAVLLALLTAVLLLVGRPYKLRPAVEKSGGETQTPYYVAIAASFAQMYSGRETVRILMLDEAFNNMDEDRIESMKAQLIK